MRNKDSAFLKKIKYCEGLATPYCLTFSLPAMHNNKLVFTEFDVWLDSFSYVCLKSELDHFNLSSVNK